MGGDQRGIPGDANVATWRGTAYLRSAIGSVTEAGVISRLAADLALAPGSTVALFASPAANLRLVAEEAEQRFAGVTVVGCTTAGEIGADGYATDSIVAVGFPREHFACGSILVPDLSDYDQHALALEVISARAHLARSIPAWKTEFGLTLIDGLSRREDDLNAALATALGQMPLFGGSAADGFDFGKTCILYRGKVLANAAVITLVRTACDVRIFSLDHLSPTETRMVVTAADPETRTVYEINAEPAAREYARILGKDPMQLNPMTFASHPVLVRLGGQYHVRSIQRMDDDGNLVFFSAIDEGLVLRLAEPSDIAAHLDSELSALGRVGAPDAILGFDCLHRRLEVEEKQLNHVICGILSRHKVVGFNSYGEQFNSRHVNQTLTGVAIYPPGTMKAHDAAAR